MKDVPIEGVEIMKRILTFGLVVLNLILNCAFTFGGEEGLVAHWMFDEGKGKVAVDSITGRKDQIERTFGTSPEFPVPA